MIRAAAAAATAGAAGCAVAVSAQVLTPEGFGAKGDGHTNDTDAFAALSAAVNALGGGIIELRPATYIVGKHARPGSTALNGRKSLAAYPPGEILHFIRCSAPVIIRGNGATLRAASGLRFGTFDPQTGRPFEHPMPFTKREFVASPYSGMIVAEECRNRVEISDIELDGNLQGLEIGGQFGNKGWQIPATGIRLIRNSGPEILARIFIHHQALDGLTIDGPPERSASSTVTDVNCDFNARQGCSITGGRNYAFSRCNFRKTGRAAIHSGPGAGVDIEAEGKSIRNISFANCEYSDNAGVGMVADSGDSADVTFDSCRFIGTTNWSAWPKKPRFRFTNCLFAGAVVRAYGDSDPANAAQFRDCRFSDDPSLSPTGEIFGGRGKRKTLAILAGENVLLDRCSFEAQHGLELPMSSANVIYSNCTMIQSGGGQSHPKGTYIGTNQITGNADLSGSRIRGEVLLNGHTIRDLTIG